MPLTSTNYVSVSLLLAAVFLNYYLSVQNTNESLQIFLDAGCL